MKSYEFKRVYHPKLGKFIYRHKGSGLIVDNIFKPMKSVMSSVATKFVKPIAQKALKSGISHASEQVGKKMSEKSGDLIMKRLRNMRQRTLAPLNKEMTTPLPIKNKQQKESTDMIINRLISGSGVKRRR